MVVIGAALQSRLLKAANEQLGPRGDEVVRQTAQRALGVPLEQVAYRQLQQLLAAVEQDAPAEAGRQSAFALAEALDRLHQDADTGLSGRVIGAVAKQLGPAAEPFLVNVAAKLGLVLADIERSNLPQLATAVETEATQLLGPDSAAELARAVQQSRAARPPGLVEQVTEIATEQIGPAGDEWLRALCRERLECHLEELDVDGIGLLARAVERDGPSRFAATRAATFTEAAKLAIASPAAPVRAKILEAAKKQVGPAGADFLKRACAKHGLPFDAIDTEQIAWLTEVIRTEAVALLGSKKADALAASIRAVGAS